MEAVLQSLHDSPVGEPGWSANKMKNTVPVRLHTDGGEDTAQELRAHQESTEQEMSLLTLRILKEGASDPALLLFL